MATFRGIAAIGTGVLALLDDAWARDPFVADTMETSLIRAEDLKERPFAFGVTLLVHRVAVSGTSRNTPPTVDGPRRPLSFEVDFVVIAWGPSVQRELELLGWCMRVLDDEPVLTPALLNRAVPSVFAATEIVQVVANPLPLAAHSRLGDDRLSAAYTARAAGLEL